MSGYGKLYLLPVFLGQPDPDKLSPQLLTKARTLSHFVVENEKTARAFLKAIGTPVPMSELSLSVLDEQTPAAAIPSLLDPLLKGIDCGLMSEAGCPGIADPGSELVRLAHAKGIPVVPFAGPSSILLGLMASGLNGQRFRFHGYLPREANERKQALRELEKEIRRSGETQLFIETPYRNQAMFDDILEQISGEILLAIGCELNDVNEMMITRSLQEWKKNRPDLHKRPCIFLLGQAAGSITSPRSKDRPLPPPRRRR